MLILSSVNSLAGEYLSEVRNVDVQNDRMRFRSNLEKLGFLLANEISKSLSFERFQNKTPLGIKESHRLTQQPVLIAILRAGLPFYQGFQQAFDKADSGFIGSFRQNEGNKEEIVIESGYFTHPELDDKDVILIDPMLATGKSFKLAIEKINHISSPKRIHIACLVASEAGVKELENESNCSIWAVDVDKELNDQAYIVPGLGDAGDLSFGEKVFQN